MALHESLQADLYQQGLAQFNRGEWAAAIQSFTELQDVSDAYPDVDQLVADARLKLQFEGSDIPVALAPPRPSILLPVIMVVALALLVAGGYVGFQWFNQPAPVIAKAVPTEVPPTSTPRIEPTPRPTVPPAPTVIAPGMLSIKAAEGGSFITTPANIDIILDASGSMLANVGEQGPERWEVARDALRHVLDAGVLPLESYVGVRTYGRNRGKDCSDLEVVQPLEPYSYERVLNTINMIKPVPHGMTPLAASLRASNMDLAHVMGSSAVILVTDGIESCDGDPAAEAAKLVEGGPNRKVHVIGFAIDDPVASATLSHIAAKGNGLYFDANDSAQLAEALQQTVVIDYTITTPSGDTVSTGSVGQGPIQLNPGNYQLRVEVTPPLVQDFSIKNGGSTEIFLSQGTDGFGAEVVGQR